jgi:hypothetical protein
LSYEDKTPCAKEMAIVIFCITENRRIVSGV